MIFLSYSSSFLPSLSLSLSLSPPFPLPSLMDRMYCLSSKSAFTDFIRCPRRYLLHPCPQIPCKICVVGPPTSGKTSLTKALAEHYNATVSFDLISMHTCVLSCIAYLIKCMHACCCACTSMLHLCVCVCLGY